METTKIITLVWKSRNNLWIFNNCPLQGLHHLSLKSFVRAAARDVPGMGRSQLRDSADALRHNSA